MKKPKLIFLNGFAASGKSTLAKKYLDDHKFALGIEGDVLLTMLGGWRNDVEGARKIAINMNTNLIKEHLALGYDVVLPFLLTNVKDAEFYEQLATQVNASFCEIYLELDHDEAIERLFRRGVWGEEGLPPLTEADLPEAEQLYTDMVTSISLRPNTISIRPQLGAIEETYQELLSKLK